MDKSSEPTIGSMQEYTLSALKMLESRGNRYSDLDISEIAGVFMQADLKFNGRGNIFGWRKFFLRRYLINKHRSKARQDKTIREYTNTSPNLEYYEDEDYLYLLEGLTEIEAHIVMDRVLYGKTFHRIGAEFNIRPREAKKIYFEAKEKIRNEHQYLDG